MNHAPLELCKAIAPAFTDAEGRATTEFVRAKNNWLQTGCFLLFGTEDKEGYGVAKRSGLGHKYKRNPDNPYCDIDLGPRTEDVYPAPTCEELGVWLAEFCARSGEKNRLKKFGKYRHTVEFLIIAAWEDNEMRGGNETQARAEAVKLILEQQ